MGPLTGQHALITGGGTGIGAAIAQTLADAGAAITVAGRREKPLKDLAARLPRTATVTADVTRESDCAAMIAAARGAHGPVDIVIANAGAAESAPLAKTDTPQWERMIAVNLTGAFQTARAALGDVTRRRTGLDGAGRIVFIASTAGLKGYPYVAAYCAAKHGVIGLMRALSVELARQPVTVNAVCPGFTETPLLATSVGEIVAKTGRTDAEARKELARANPQGRFITPQEVAQTVLWLCLPSSGAITGQAISVSGGET